LNHAQALSELQTAWQHHLQRIDADGDGVCIVNDPLQLLRAWGSSRFEGWRSPSRSVGKVSAPAIADGARAGVGDTAIDDAVSTAAVQAFFRETLIPAVEAAAKYQQARLLFMLGAVGGISVRRAYSNHD
jgi:hypothetical protein